MTLPGEDQSRKWFRDLTFLVSLISTHPPDGALSRTSLRPRPRSQRSSASIASGYDDQCARARNIFIGAEHFHPSLRYEGPCLTRAAEPPADQCGTLASPAHSQRESRNPCIVSRT